MNEAQLLFDQIKELLELKFSEMEKRLELKDTNNDLRFEVLETQNEKLGIRVSNIEASIQASKASTWGTIKEAFIKWVVPFVIVGTLFYLTGGKF